MTIPYTFASQAGPIPLAQLDSNFAAPITLGTTTMTLGNTTTTVDGLTLTNPTVNASNTGQLAGLRNKIINGNMGIAQRGTAAVTTSGSYGPADRWFTDIVGDTFSTTQGAFVSGDTLYDTGGAQYYTQIAVTSVAGAGNYANFAQRIEDVRILAGQTVTVSFWAKAASGTPLIGLQLLQNFGTGGTPSAINEGVGQSQAITTTWTKYSKTFSITSLNGKTLGTTANTNFTKLVFWLDAGSTYNTASGSIGQSSKTVSIAQVQLEIGPVATPFEQRPIGMELALCQRYYEKSYDIPIAPGSISALGAVTWNCNTISSTVFPRSAASFAVNKRTTPSVTLYSTGSGSSAAATCVRNADASVDALGAAAVIGERGFTVQQASTTLTSGSWMLTHYVASAEL